MTAHRVARYERAQRALRDAERRHALSVRREGQARTTRGRRDAQNATAHAWEVVETRRQELIALEAFMTTVPASAAHRGTRHFQHVTTQMGSNF